MLDAIFSTVSRPARDAITKFAKERSRLDLESSETSRALALAAIGVAAGEDAIAEFEVLRSLRARISATLVGLIEIAVDAERKGVEDAVSAAQTTLNGASARRDHAALQLTKMRGQFKSTEAHDRLTGEAVQTDGVIFSARQSLNLAYERLNAFDQLVAPKMRADLKAACERG